MTTICLVFGACAGAGSSFLLQQDTLARSNESAFPSKLFPAVSAEVSKNAYTRANWPIKDGTVFAQNLFFGCDCPATFFGLTYPLCTPCPAGSFCPRASRNATVCVAGSYCPASVASPIVCEAGRYCPMGSMNQVILSFVHCQTTPGSILMFVADWTQSDVYVRACVCLCVCVCVPILFKRFRQYVPRGRIAMRIRQRSFCAPPACSVRCPAR